MNPDPQFLYQFMLTIGFLGAVSVAWMALRNQSKSQKREVSFADSFATAEELARVDATLTRRIDATDRSVMEMKDAIVRNGEIRKAAIEAKVEAARAEAQTEAKEIRKEISALAVEITAVKTTGEMTHNSLALINQKLDRMQSDSKRTL